MRIQLDFREIEKTAQISGDILRDVDTARDKFLGRAAKLIEQQAMSHHRFDSRTGRLASAIEVQIVGDTAEISVNELKAPYATFIHGGTGMWGPGRRMYAIHPREHRALAFDGHLARRVMHPGISPDPFLYDAADNMRDRVLEIFSEELDTSFAGGD